MNVSDKDSTGPDRSQASAVAQQTGRNGHDAAATKTLVQHDMYAFIPAELKARPQWVAARADKKPVNPWAFDDGAHLAEPNNPETWGTFEDALEAAQRWKMPGIGYVFSEEDPYVGIDLDHCLEQTYAGDRAVKAWARPFVEQLASYTEISRSGDGLHIIVRGKLPPGGHKKSFGDGAVEMYDERRYFIMTGQNMPHFRVADTKTVKVRAGWRIEERGAELARLHAQVFGGAPHEPVRPAAPENATEGAPDEPSPAESSIAPPSGTPVPVLTKDSLTDDGVILQRAMADPKHGVRFFHLFFGDISLHGLDDSAADIALCGELAFWCGRNAARIDRLFRLSRLYQHPGRAAKWDKVHSAKGLTYGQMTIQKAITGKRQFYDWQREEPAEVELICAADVREVPLFWLWPGYIPLAKAIVLDGEPDKGKSTVLLDIIARLSRGDPFPQGVVSELDGPQASIILSCEDDAADTIVPRLRVAGADLSRVHVLQDVAGDDGRRRLFTIPQDVGVLRELIGKTSAKLVVVDPLVGYLDQHVDSHNDAGIRRALRPLHHVAQQTGAAIVGIRHFKKDREEKNLLHRGGGSIGIIGAARGGLAVIPDSDPSSHRRYFGVSKHNLQAGDTPTLTFEVIGIDTQVAGVTRSLPAIHWLGTDARTMAEVSAEDGHGERVDAGKKTAKSACFTFVEQFMGDGQEHRTTEIEAAIASRGISSATWRRCREDWERLGRLVKAKYPAKKRDDGSGASDAAFWTWRLVVRVVDIEPDQEGGEDAPESGSSGQ